ncbi:G-type lectin S-receptor-like serine/threonine-protein kinase [Acorus gramineus]|uniref:G-type lectin S-receptor-like serine/threonine-protein kinase n=1 Tax=Acorus gramineus TaxID=55184 RepID=A0AAV9BEZ8_ACOGR|nr:G-type lectin S-receptor-like serine/threonine-protein kinase [Acorus gramineus]
MKMLKVAIWCLQSDCNKRPSMSNVVKVLEGAAEMNLINSLPPLVTPQNKSPPVSSSNIPFIGTGTGTGIPFRHSLHRH